MGYQMGFEQLPTTCVFRLQDFCSSPSCDFDAMFGFKAYVDTVFSRCPLSPIMTLHKIHSAANGLMDWRSGVLGYFLVDGRYKDTGALLHSVILYRKWLKFKFGYVFLGR